MLTRIRHRFRGNNAYHVVTGSGTNNTAVLDQVCDVTTCAGLHCAPQAHGTAGTLDCGALRCSPGYLNTANNVRYAVKSLQEIVPARWPSSVAKRRSSS